MMISGSKRLRVSPDTISVRELLTLVQAGVAQWQQELQNTDGVDRERAATAIKDLSRILDSLSQQLAQGRETIQITSRLPVMRAYTLGCPVCGHGNRAGARFCLACGSPLSSTPGTQLATTVTLRLDVAAQSDRGQTRENNEDTCSFSTIALPTGGSVTLLLVADGMGGARAGQEASRLAGETMQHEVAVRVRQAVPAGDAAWQTVLREAAQVANRRVYDQAQADITKRGMGTTLTVVVVAGNRAHLAHVGDSRVYLINPNGVTEDGSVLLQLTSDHTLVARLIDIGQLSPEQAHTHAHRNMLYRSLGTEPVIEIDTSSHAVGDGDTLVLCSDGLTTHVADAELAAMVLETSQPEIVCNRLVTRANQRGGVDNISVIVARIRRV